MKFTIPKFIIAVLITSLFYLSFHLSFWAGALAEKRSRTCISQFELKRMGESIKFFDDILKVQQNEVDILRKKCEENMEGLKSCQNKNWKLQQDIDKLGLPSEI